MAKLVGAYAVVHTPFCYMPPERWNEVRASRSLREDVPMESLEECKEKAERIQHGFAEVRQKLKAAKPDVLVVFGDDQLECFDFNNYPSFMVYVGDEFKGALTGDGSLLGSHGDGQLMKGHPELGTAILTGLMQRGFDPAFAMDMPKPEKGIGHAIMRPAESLTDFDIPIVPVLVNCYFAPQVTARRSYQFGKAIREIIDEFPEDIRVAVIGSGGLWHTPGGKDAWLGEEFDRGELEFLEAGDARGMAEYFDAYEIPAGDLSQPVGERGRTSTGLPASSGPQGGTREICNWIVTAGVVDGSRATVVDYIPVYASPVGAAFAYWEKV